jgi:hypothetical protein
MIIEGKFIKTIFSDTHQQIFKLINFQDTSSHALRDDL